MLVRSIFFSQYVQKIEKLMLGLSKQHNKMLKIKPEMLKIRKWQNNQTREKFPGNFPGNIPNPGNYEYFQKIYRFPGS